MGKGSANICDSIFDEMAQRLKDDPKEAENIVKKAKAAFQFKVPGVGDYWANLKKGTGEIGKGKCPVKADVTITVDEANLVSLIEGKLTPQGKIKLQGNIMKAQKMEGLLKARRDAGETLKSVPGMKAPAASAASASSVVENVFAELTKQLAADPSAVKKAQSVFCFSIKDVGDWTVDLKNGAGKIEKGKPAKADCTLILSEPDFMALMGGKLNAQTAFMQGKLKIKGNMMKAQKLEVLMKPKAKM